MSASVVPLTPVSPSKPETLRLAARLNPMIREPSLIVVCGVSADFGVADLAIEIGRCFALMRGAAILAADFGFTAPPRPGFAAVAGRPGMREALSGAKTLAEVEASDAPGLRLIGTGGTLAASGPLLGPDLSVLADGLRARYRVSFVVVDPLLLGPTGLRLARIADGIIIAASAGTDRRDDLATSIGLLEQMEATVLGCVLIEQ